MKSRIWQGIVIAGLVFGGLQVGSPAQAGACSTDLLCMYVDINYGGSVKGFNSKPRVHNLKGDFKKTVSSVRDGLDVAVLVYFKKDAKGTHGCLAPNSSFADLTKLNDAIASIKVTKKDACP